MKMDRGHRGQRKFPFLVLIHFTLPSGSPSIREAKQECCFLACSPWLAQLAFLCSLPRDGTAYSGMGPPTSTNKEKMPTGQADGENPSAGVPTPQVTLVCLELTKKKKTSQHSAQYLNHHFSQGVNGQYLQWRKSSNNSISILLRYMRASVKENS